VQAGKRLDEIFEWRADFFEELVACWLPLAWISFASGQPEKAQNPSKWINRSERRVMAKALCFF
jgi:hypothetical protein